MFQSLATVEKTLRITFLIPSVPVLLSSINLTISKDLQKNYERLAEMTSVTASNYISIKKPDSQSSKEGADKNSSLRNDLKS